MLQTVNVSLPKKLVARIDERVKEYGYTSRAEFIREVLREVVLRTKISFEEEEVKLSPEAAKRYDKMIEEIKKGKSVYRAKNVEDFFRQLSE